MTKVYASVYGCPSNIADCEMALGLLQEAGFEIVNSLEESDLNIIFTCIVKTPTEQRMIRKIQELTKTGKSLIVAGCMTKTSQRAIEKINPDASLIGPDTIENIADAARAALEKKKVIFVRDSRKTKPGLPRHRKNENIGIIPISTGCLSRCSYCVVKFARGKLKSYPAGKIVEDVKKLIEDGSKEIWLTSQDNGCYGVDIGENLAALLKKVCEVEGEYNIRVGMMNPTYVKDEKLLEELIEAYKNEKIMKFLHLPVQSGSDKILRTMRRGYSVADFKKIVTKFRKEIPDLVLSTDVIVGFPGESEEDFQMTMHLMERIKPNKVNISKFGARPDTSAADMEQTPMNIINERSRRMYDFISSFSKS